MSFEIRPMVPEESEEFNRVVKVAFAQGGEFPLKMPPEWTLCGFHDGKMATSYAAWPLIMMMNGAVVPFAGVTMVGTLPVYRRRNYLRQVTARHFQLLHEQGERPFSALFASMAAIYHRYGYGVVSTRHGYAIEPRHICFASDSKISGEFREAADNEVDLMLGIYHRFIEGRTGYLRREENYMTIPGAPFTTLTPPSGGVSGRVVYYENGETTGYIVYRIERDMREGRGMGQRLTINDLAWLTPRAYYAIWEYLGRMDLVNEIVWWRVPPDDPLPHLLLEPRRLQGNFGDGLLARIVDVEKALPRRSYSESGILVFEVIDDLCPWNHGRWKLEATPEGSRITRTAETAQCVMPVSTLAMLYFGQLAASAAARMGRLDVSDVSALATWDRVMRTDYRPFCADSF